MQDGRPQALPPSHPAPACPTTATVARESLTQKLQAEGEGFEPINPVDFKFLNARDYRRLSDTVEKHFRPLLVPPLGPGGRGDL
jgi:hypothetical protein